MARRGFGSTALRAALGAATGVAEGLQQRELLAAQRKKEEDTMRQAQQMGMANLMLQGFEAPAVTMERQQGARQAAGSAIASALQAASGQAPTPIMGDFEALAGGYATARPDRTVTLGGQALTLRETPTERQERLGRTQTMMANQAFENAVAQLPAELQPVARASKVLPSNVMQALVQPPRQEGMTEYQREMIRLREEEMRDGRQSRAEAKAKETTPEKQDILQMRTRAGMNEMLLADRSMRDFEEQFKSGQVKVTVGQRVLQKLATDFANEKTPIDKIITSSAYKALAEANPALVEYMRNVDAFAEGETMISSRPSNFRTKMAQFLSGIAAGSPVEVVNRVQQRRRGLLAPMVEGYAGGNWDAAYQSATAEAGAGPSAATETPQVSKAAFGAQWKAANPKQANETPQAYALRMQQAWQAASQGGRK